MSRIALLCRMAFRNLFAYRRRSLLTAAVVFAGVFAIAVADAFMNGFGDRLVRGFAVAGGQLRVSAPGYGPRRALCPLDRLLPDPAALEALAAAAARAGAERAGAADTRVRALPSIRAACVVQRGERSLNLVAQGADARDGAGGLAPPFADPVLAAGRWPAAGERGAVLSAKAAARLGAAPGDALVLLSADAFGSFGVAELPLLGVTAGNPGAESCLLDLGTMCELSGVDGGATELSLWLVDPRGLPLDPRLVAAELGAMEAAIASAGFEAGAWDAAGAPTAAIVGFLDSFIYVLYAVFAIVAGAGIANAVLLSVQDRIRDFGTLRAVAFTARTVKAIVALETLFLGLGASLAAALASFGCIALLGPGGLRLPESTRGIAAWMPESIAARVDPASLALIVAGGCLLPLLASAWPLRALGRMSIREALSGV